MVQHITDIVNVAGQSVERSTLTGLQKASLKSGVSFQYLVAKAAQESSLQTGAQADSSSATGLFQFTRGTWLDMMKKYGALYGYGALADKISVADSGKTTVTDQPTEQRILSLRNNAETSALMAAEYARDNAVSLHDALGRGVDAGDLYLAHFLGANGATQLLNAATHSPSSSAAALLPAAAKANPSVFYAADGKARSSADVVKLVRERFLGQMDRYADVASAMSGEKVGAAPAVVQTPTAPPHTQHAASPAEDSTKKMINHFMIEELAKLIASKPMVMTDGSEEQDNSTTSLSSGGFQGNDWASAMTNALTKNTGDNGLEDAAALARNLAKGRTGDAMRTYDMLNAVPGAPFLQPRKQR